MHSHYTEFPDTILLFNLIILNRKKIALLLLFFSDSFRFCKQVFHQYTIIISVSVWWASYFIYWVGSPGLGSLERRALNHKSSKLPPEKLVVMKKTRKPDKRDRIAPIHTATGFVTLVKWSFLFFILMLFFHSLCIFFFFP